MLEPVVTSNDFLESCRVLIKGGEYSAKIDRDRIIHYPNFECSFGHKGGYVGGYFNSGNVGQYKDFYYCPLCDKVVERSWSFGGEGNKLLALLKAQAIQESLSGVHGSFGRGDYPKTTNPCPKCKGNTMLYLKEWDPDPMSYYECSFLVCVNPECDWLGESHMNQVSQG